MSQGADVNTESGFRDALAEAAGRSDEEIQNLPEVGESTDVQSGLTTEESSSPPRDEQGRFTARQEEPEEPVAPEPEEEPEAPGEEPEPEEPQVSERELALQKQLDDAQKFIGTQADALGKIREELAEIRGATQARQQGPAPAIPVVDEQTLEALDGLMEDEGVDAAMQWVWQNRPELVEEALESAAALDKNAARPWAQAYWSAVAEAEQQSQQPAEPTQPQVDPTLAQIKQERQIGQVILDVKQLSGGNWDTISPHLVEAFGGAPDLVKQAVLSEDPTLRASGVEALHSLASARAVAQATSTASEEAKAQAAARKQAAQVATGSLRPAPTRQPGETPGPEDVQAAIKRFQDSVLEAGSTSVQDGLTYG